MKNTIYKLFFSTIIFGFIFFIGANVNADPKPGLEGAFGQESFLDNVADKGGYQVNSTANTVNYIIGDVILAALSLIGVVFLILMVYAGYMWMTARGDEQKVTKAKDTITASIIGIIIVVAAYAISYYVISKLGAGTLRSTVPPPTPPST
jgi:hypothetical protein